jgi:hypothetical protein
LYIEGLVPPKHVCHQVKGGERDCHKFKFCDGQMLCSSCNALHQKPSGLQDRKAFGQKVSLTSVSDLFLSYIGEIYVAVLSKGFDLFQGERMDWSILITKHKPPHAGEESVSRCPCGI